MRLFCIGGLVALALLTPVASAQDLQPGADAPKLTIAEWVKGDAVAELEKNKVYVVEFWATWCGPCIRGIPHLTKLQQTYKEKGVTIISVTAKDENNPLEKVKEMVASRGEGMGYTVAWDTERKTYDAWMTAAGQKGIPTSFVVDKNGKVAYIGHPMFLDLVLEKCVAGTWDPVKGAAELAAQREKLGACFQAGGPVEILAALDQLVKEHKNLASVVAGQRLGLLFKAKRYDDAIAHAKGLAKEAVLYRDSMTLNQVAWTIVDPAQKWPKRDLILAMDAALKAVEFTKGKDPAILDTLARVHAQKGEFKKAIEIQTNAVKLAKDSGNEELIKQLSTTLEEYTAAAAKKAEGQG